MNHKPNTQQKYISAITELWNENHFRVFHHSKAKLIWQKFSVTLAMNTILTRIGIIEFCGKGYSKFTRQPTNQDCILTYQTNLQSMRAYMKSKGKKVKETQEIPPPPTTEKKLSPISEDLCISYLKERGYKIMKLEFKEV